MKQKIIWWTLTLLCTVAVLFLGLQPASASSKLSKPIADLVIEQDTTIQELSPSKQDQAKMEKHNGVRDNAHVCMFAVLSVCACMLAYTYVKRYWFCISVPACMAFSFLDEALQHVFAKGRLFQLSDVWRDWLGTAIGLAIVAVITWRLNKKQEAAAHGVSGSGA